MQAIFSFINHYVCTNIFFKRCFDFIIALVALICLAPLLLIVTLLVAFCKQMAVVLFSYKSARADMRRFFRVIKFKTMSDERDANGRLLPDEQRLTRVGRFVRSTSIDELPQFINVLKGDMSLIGPRPLLVRYLPLYSPEQARRHEVRPGISGWAQCHGRNAISWKQKFAYDVWYVDHLSLMTDLKVVYYTIKSVLKREGISQEGQATMEFFDGTN